MIPRISGLTGGCQASVFNTAIILKHFMHVSVARLFKTALFLAIFTSVSIPVGAADKKTDPSGLWLWTFTLQNGDTIEPKLNLTLIDGKLSGKVTGRPGEEAEIEDAKLKGDELTFRVVRERDGNRTAIKFNGKISDDRLNGTIEIDRNGEVTKHDWEAKRESRAVSAAGTWKYSFTTQNGQTIDSVLRLKQEGDKLTGTVTVDNNPTSISEAKLKGNEISFKIVHERDGRTSTSIYRGKIDGDTMKGTLTFSRGGEDRTIDLEGKRSRD